MEENGADIQSGLITEKETSPGNEKEARARSESREIAENIMYINHLR